MDLEWKKPKQKMNYSKLPTKRSINLVNVGQKGIQIKIAAPAIVLIILAAALFSKFAVVDRLLAVSRAESEVALLQQELDAKYAAIEKYGNITEEYAHFTYSDFHPDEVNRADRKAVIELLQKHVYPKASIGAWFLVENELTLPITCASLKDVNQIVKKLETLEEVDFCTINNASTGDLGQSGLNLQNGNERNTNIVTAQVTVYLKDTATLNEEKGGTEDENTES